MKGSQVSHHTNRETNVCVCVYLGGSVAEAFEQQGDNMNSSSSDLCLLLSLYQGSETGAQLCASSQTEKHININTTNIQTIT